MVTSFKSAWGIILDKWVPRWAAGRGLTLERAGQHITCKASHKAEALLQHHDFDSLDYNWEDKVKGERFFFSVMVEVLFDETFTFTLNSSAHAPPPKCYHRVQLSKWQTSKCFSKYGLFIHKSILLVHPASNVIVTYLSPNLNVTIFFLKTHLNAWIVWEVLRGSLCRDRTALRCLKIESLSRQ